MVRLIKTFLAKQQSCQTCLIQPPTSPWLLKLVATPCSSGCLWSLESEQGSTMPQKKIQLGGWKDITATKMERRTTTLLETSQATVQPCGRLARNTEDCQKHIRNEKNIEQQFLYIFLKPLIEKSAFVFFFKFQKRSQIAVHAITLVSIFTRISILRTCKFFHVFC